MWSHILNGDIKLYLFSLIARWILIPPNHIPPFTPLLAGSTLSMSSELILVRGYPNENSRMAWLTYPQGDWREWISRRPCRRPARPKRLSCQRVRDHRNRYFVGSDELGRTVRDARLVANREIYQKVYGTAVDIIAVDDLIRGDFTAALRGE